MKDLLIDYLGKAEGTHIHYNKGEFDITAPYGIYRHEHPGAAIFTYINTIAKKVGMDPDSSVWDNSDIDKMNSYLDHQIVIDLTKEFYDGYFKDSPLDNLPKDVYLAFYSVYTNSQVLGVKALQMAFWNMKKSNAFEFKTELSIVDGYNGSKTKRAAEEIKEACRVSTNPFLGLYLEALMISSMKSLYIIITAKNPDRNLRSIRGWSNRLQLLERMR